MTLSQWSKARVHKDNEANLQTYQVGARLEALDTGYLMALLDPRYTQVGFNFISVQVCINPFIQMSIFCALERFHSIKYSKAPPGEIKKVIAF